MHKSRQSVENIHFIDPISNKRSFQKYILSLVNPFTYGY